MEKFANKVLGELRNRARAINVLLSKACYEAKAIHLIAVSILWIYFDKRKLK